MSVITQSRGVSHIKTMRPAERRKLLVYYCNINPQPANRAKTSKCPLVTPFDEYERNLRDLLWFMKSADEQMRALKIAEKLEVMHRKSPNAAIVINAPKRHICDDAKPDPPIKITYCQKAHQALHREIACTSEIIATLKSRVHAKFARYAAEFRVLMTNAIFADFYKIKRTRAFDLLISNSQ